MKGVHKSIDELKGKKKEERMALLLLGLPDDTLCAIFTVLLNVGALHGLACTTCHRFRALLKNEWKLKLCKGVSLNVAVRTCLERIMPAAEVMVDNSLKHPTFYSNGEFEFMSFRIYELTSKAAFNAWTGTLEEVSRRNATRLKLLTRMITALHNGFAESASTDPRTREIQARLCNNVFHHTNRVAMCQKEMLLELPETLVHAAEYAQTAGPGKFEYNSAWSQSFLKFRNAFPDAPAHQGPSPKRAISANDVKLVTETLELLRWEEAKRLAAMNNEAPNHASLRYPNPVIYGPWVES